MRKPVEPVSGLKGAGVSRRAEALFRTMGSDYLLREQFVTDPVDIYFEYVHGRKPPPEQSAATSHLIYAVLSSRPMLQWFHDRLAKSHAQQPAREAFVQEFGRAAARKGAEPVTSALLHAALHGDKVLGFSDDFPFFLLDGGILAKGFVCGDVSVTPLGPATDTGTTTPATDTGPTQRATDTGTTQPSTDTGPTQPATDTGPTQPATDTGTTTPATDIWPSGNVQFTGVETWAQPLNALAAYANQLRETGALESVWGPLP